jgi:hypothetical protein
MKTLKGPGIYLAQFATDEAPFNSLPAFFISTSQSSGNLNCTNAWTFNLHKI